MSDGSESGVSVQREEELAAPGQSGWVTAQSYASLGNDDLLRGIQVGNGCVLLRSTDGGTTWGDRQVVAESKAAGENLVLSPSVASLYLDPRNGLLVCFISEIIYRTGGGIAYGDASGYGPHTKKLFYRISRDAGHTWEAAQQLVEAGPEYDSQHWARDVWYGQSSLVIEGQSP